MLGTEIELRDLLCDLQRDYECSGQLLGYHNDSVRELKFLGRSIRLVEGGLESEGDRRAHLFLSFFQNLEVVRLLRAPSFAA